MQVRGSPRLASWFELVSCGLRTPDLDHTLAEMATRMAALGDRSSLGVRRAHALRMLAGHQRHLDVFDQHPADGDAVGGLDGVGQAEERPSMAAATLDLLRDWLQRTSGVIVRPVLDPTRSEAVDRHDPPEWMREAVALRDGHCVYPGCGIDARSCDRDHTLPYVPLRGAGLDGLDHPRCDEDYFLGT